MNCFFLVENNRMMNNWSFWLALGYCRICFIWSSVEWFLLYQDHNPQPLLHIFSLSYKIDTRIMISKVIVNPISIIIIIVIWDLLWGVVMPICIAVIITIIIILNFWRVIVISIVILPGLIAIITTIIIITWIRHQDPLKSIRKYWWISCSDKP